MKLTQMGAFAAVLLACFASTPIKLAAANPPAGTVNISLTGFCDGMQLTVTNNVLWGGTLTGCLSGTASGTQSFQYGANPFAFPAVGLNIGSSAAAPGCILFYLFNFSNNTWANYEGCGSTPTLINSGSFTYTKSPGVGGKSSNQP